MKLRNLVVQFFINPEKFEQPKYNALGNNDELLKYSLYSAELYANRIYADYKLVSDARVNWIHPTFERFDLFYNDSWWEQYDQILYLDTDVIVWPDAPSVFDLYTNLKSFKPVLDIKAKRRPLAHHEKTSSGTCLESFSAKELQQKRFNAGVFVITKESAQRMKSYLDCAKLKSDDNQMLIYAMLKSGVDVEYMDPRFNKKNGGPGWYFGHAFGQEKFTKNFRMIDDARVVFPNVD